eukprot:5012459-Prorocentrum_lima.AAC.1
MATARTTAHYHCGFATLTVHSARRTDAHRKPTPDQADVHSRPLDGHPLHAPLEAVAEDAAAPPELCA